MKFSAWDCQYDDATTVASTIIDRWIPQALRVQAVTSCADNRHAIMKHTPIHPLIFPIHQQTRAICTRPDDILKKNEVYLFK